MRGSSKLILSTVQLTIFGGEMYIFIVSIYLMFSFVHLYTDLYTMYVFCESLNKVLGGNILSPYIIVFSKQTE